MNFSLLDFIPSPIAEMLPAISLISLIFGICFACIGAILLFHLKHKKKKTTVSWIFICIGTLLIVNHGIQLLFIY
jgi:hypothetical protein